MRDPEGERLLDRWYPSRLSEVLILPVTLVRDWIVRPIYNDVFAALLDSFVIGRLWRKCTDAICSDSCRIRS